jgi:hypothetical protein
MVWLSHSLAFSSLEVIENFQLSIGRLFSWRPKLVIDDNQICLGHQWYSGPVATKSEGEKHITLSIKRWHKENFARF